MKRNDFMSRRAGLGPGQSIERLIDLVTDPDASPEAVQVALSQASESDLSFALMGVARRLKACLRAPLPTPPHW